MSKETKEWFDRLDYYEKWIALRWLGLSDFMKEVVIETRHNCIMNLQACQLKEFNHD
jgi:hypothetical protein